MTGAFPPDPAAAGEAADRWRRVETLFHAALERPTTQRGAFLAGLSGDAAALRDEVAALLAADAAPAPLLEQTAPLPAGTAPHAARPVRGALRAGERVGAYRVLRTVGRGAASTVYLAADDAGREVALKVVAREQPVPRFAERFAREVRLARRLHHPNVLPVIDAGETAELLWLAMPFVATGTLRDRVRREGRLPLGDALRVGRDVALALAYAHAQAVMHRDVKPENVLLVADGSARLADFGISRALVADDPDSDRLTATGFMLGTPDYMSPEQLSGVPVDHRTDIYSLGCVVHELLTGRPPFITGTRLAGLWRRISEPAPSVRAELPEVPEDVDAIVRHALARDPAERTDSAAALAALLDRALAAAG